MHQLEQVPAFHPFTIAVERWQIAIWIPLLDIKVLLCPFLQLCVHQQTVTRTAARPCLVVALLQIFRCDGNIVSDTVHLAEITILHVQRQHVVRHFGRARTVSGVSAALCPTSCQINQSFSGVVGSVVLFVGLLFITG